jgi:parvulin-like peptidyl-prolyl isomerase
MGRLLIVSALLGCSSSHVNVDAELAELKRLPIEQLQAAAQSPAPGPWWGAPEQMENVRLAARHVLIAHAEIARDAELLGARFQGNRRSRTDALLLATAISRRLAQNPEQFAALSRRYSDDGVACDHGGLLGVFGPRRVPTEIVDTLGRLAIDQVSAPVETQFGFHVLQRIAVPKETQVAGAHLVIKYRGSEGWRRASAPATRDRSEARALAERLAQELRGHPERFDMAVARYSEAYDAIEDGDLGLWSTYDVGPTAIVTRLAEMKVGEVDGPFETTLGFEIIKRTEGSPRPRFAVSRIIIGHSEIADPLAAGSRSRQEAAAIAADVLAEVKRDPSRFDVLRAEHCAGAPCSVDADAWTRGQLPGFAAITKALPIGAIHEAVLDTPMGYEVVRREQPRERPLAVYSPELPQPLPPTLEQMVERMQPAILAGATRAMATDLRARLGLNGETAALFEQRLEHLASVLASPDPGLRVAAVREARQDLMTLLGPDRYADFARLREEWLHERVPF